MQRGYRIVENRSDPPVKLSWSSERDLDGSRRSCEARRRKFRKARVGIDGQVEMEGIAPNDECG